MLFDKKIHFIYSDDSVYESAEQVFYNPEQYPEIKAIEDNFDVIKQEVSPYIRGEVKIDASNPNAPDVNYPDTWKHIYFMNYRWQFRQTHQLFPKTSRLLKQHPTITLAGIASLEAGGKLLPHVGETNAIIRCHLGIKIPGTLPQCGLRVKDEHRGWEEGKVVCFNDAFNHEAWNLTNEKRYIMIFDIIRPEFARYKNRVCAYSLGIASSRYLLQLLKVKRPLPIGIRKLLVYPFFIGWLLYLKAQNIWFK